MNTWIMRFALVCLLCSGCGNPFSKDTKSPLIGVWQAQEMVFIPTAINTIAFIRDEEYYENDAEGHLVQVGRYDVIQVADTTVAGVQMKNHTLSIAYFNQNQIQVVVGTTENTLEIHVHANSSRTEEVSEVPRGPRVGGYDRLHTGEGF